MNRKHKPAVPSISQQRAWTLFCLEGMLRNLELLPRYEGRPLGVQTNIDAASSSISAALALVRNSKPVKRGS